MNRQEVSDLPVDFKAVFFPQSHPDLQLCKAGKFKANISSLSPELTGYVIPGTKTTGIGY